AEVRMMQEPAALETAHETEQLAIRLSLGAYDELRRRARRRRQVRPALQPRLPRKPPGKHELRQQVAGEVLLSGKSPHDGIARALEVDRDPAREPGCLTHLALVGARQHLQVNVPRESLAPPKDLDRREQAVHGSLRAARDSRGEEEPVGG